MAFHNQEEEMFRKVFQELVDTRLNNLVDSVESLQNHIKKVEGQLITLQSDMDDVKRLLGHEEHDTASIKTRLHDLSRKVESLKMKP